MSATEINLDTIAAAVRALGVPCFVEQTGGGCATVYAGDTYTDEHGDARYLAGAGPGWFEGPGWTNARADLVDGSDFYVGLDDDGEDEQGVWVQPGTTEAEIAALIVAQSERPR